MLPDAMCFSTRSGRVDEDGSGATAAEPFYMTLCANFPDVRAALGCVAGAAESLGLEPDDLGTLEIVLAEVLNNIVEHACARRPRSRISVSIRRADAVLLVKTCDSGRAMSPGKLPEWQKPERAMPLDGLPEGGFGWHLILRLAEGVTYRRVERKNHLSFLVRLGRIPQVGKMTAILPH